MSTQEITKNESLPEVHELSNTNDILLDTQLFTQMVEFAKFMATGKTQVPDHLKNSPADCMAITMQAVQWGMNPFAVAQKTHLVNGSLGYEAQLVNAVVSTSKAIEGRFHYRYNSDEKWSGNTNPEYWVQVGAVIRGESEITWGERLYPADQTVKNSPLWKTDPKQQAAYLAIKKWARLYAPAVILGVYSVDELHETPAGPRDVTPAKSDLVPDSNVVALEHSADSDRSELDAVIDAINNASDSQMLLEAKERAANLPEALQPEARDAYEKKVASIKAMKAESQQESGPSNGYQVIVTLIEKATSEQDLIDIDQQTKVWDSLSPDEAPKLRQMIDDAKLQFTGAEGAFSQSQ